MRFNKQELLTLACQPSNKFDKEGILFMREKQESFFRRGESKHNKKVRKSRDFSCYGATAKVSTERWCRLRGNMMFYLKSRDHWSEPAGVVILENCTVKIESQPTVDGLYGFVLVFDGGISQHLAALTEDDRDTWVQYLHMASFNYVRSQLLSLEQQIQIKQGNCVDINMKRYEQGRFLDPTELPLFEVNFACDNLLCDGHGRPPNPMLIIHVQTPPDTAWTKYGQTEVIERCSNPSFLTTASFLTSDGIIETTKVRFTTYDVRERVSNTLTQIGVATVTLSAFKNTDRVRIPLLNLKNLTAGFLSLTAWNMENEDKGSTASTPCRSSPDQETLVMCHRRTQSLPPRLITKLKLPQQGQLSLLFHNPFLRTYRFHSGLGGDICVHEIMAESTFCFTFPQQLLMLWVIEEKELMQEVAGLGDLCDPWHSRQMALLDRHLRLINIYSQAKENIDSHIGPYFKPSEKKDDPMYEFLPVNLHLQRMWAQNDSLRKSAFFDVVTVGAFTANPHKYKSGGLFKLLHQLKYIANKASTDCSYNKIQMAHDTVQYIKRLRREIVEKMQTLLKLAKEKKSVGMMPVIEELMEKTRILLSVCDPCLIEEAICFLEKHRLSTPSKKTNGFEQTDSDLFSPTADIDDFDIAKKFLDTHVMCHSPTANYYKPTDEPEPYELTQLNIEASVMCLVSKVKILCGCQSSPTPRLRPRNSYKHIHSASVTTRLSRLADTEKRKSDPGDERKVSEMLTNGDCKSKVTMLTASDAIPDWFSELRPSMKKLRQAMDGLLKTARLAHSIFRLREDSDTAKLAYAIKYRRDVCFSHAITSLVTGLMARLWCQKPDPTFLFVLCRIGPIVSFEGLLSYYSTEAEMWGDMIVAIEDLKTVEFCLVPANRNLNDASKINDAKDTGLPDDYLNMLPQVSGSRSALRIHLPVPDFVYTMLPFDALRKNAITFVVTPVFFNIGINEQATLAERFGDLMPQEKSNVDNFDRLNMYYHRYRKLPRPASSKKRNSTLQVPLDELMERLNNEVHIRKSKNVEVLKLAAQISRRMMGLRFTSCKSAKDRTSMAVTLEQCYILAQEYDLAEHEFQKALDCMRSQGARRENVWKNIGAKKYAFNSLQLLAIPKLYRPPAGTFGSVET